jgi:Zn-dependent protease with chaperone function
MGSILPASSTVKSTRSDFFLQYHFHMRQMRSASTLVVVALSAVLLSAQTRITPPDNKYTPAQDVQLGREAAAEAEKQLPIMRDDAVTSYVEEIGQRLVSAIPPELRHPEFRYSFKAINVREINAFALPGGPMYVNRGMIEAAKSEGEVAGVMAHELSHVVLRHGTAQASKATKYEIGQVAGAILGSIIGGGWGQVVSQGTQFGIGTAFLRFSRAFEHDADIMGTQIMARAGYDPRDMASMFKTIEKQGGSGGPQWLSDHPNPGNRYDYITKEAQMLRVDNPIRVTRGFEQVQAHLRTLPRAPTTEEATKNAGRRTSGGSGTGTSGRVGDAPTGRVEPPSSRFMTYDEGNLFRISVPSNWRELQDNDTVTFAPTGGYGTSNGQTVYTHGMQLGITRNESHDLQTATDELVNAFAQGNPDMGRPSRYERITVNLRPALPTTISNRNEVTRGPETIQLVTTDRGNGELLYAVGVAPSDEFASYRGVFNKILGSIRLTN